MKLEYCCRCAEATGRAGAADDSLYTETGGPFCEGCFTTDEPEPSTTSDAIVVHSMQLDDMTAQRDKLLNELAVMEADRDYWQECYWCIT